MPDNKKLLPFTEQEFNDAVEEEILPSSIDDIARMYEQVKEFSDLIRNSKKSSVPFNYLVQHIRDEGPEHIEHTLAEAIALYMTVALRISERRHREAPGINELERMFSLDSGEKGDLDGSH